MNLRKEQLLQYETHLLIVSPPAAPTSPYLIVVQGGDASIAGGRSGNGDPLGGRRPLLQLILLPTLLLSREAMLP